MPAKMPLSEEDMTSLHFQAGQVRTVTMSPHLHKESGLLNVPAN